MQYFHVAVGFAGMVYVMSAVPAPAAVKAPATINCADTEPASSRAAIGFGVGYSLTTVLRYLSAAGKVGLGKTPLAFNRGALDFQTGMQLELHY